MTRSRTETKTTSVSFQSLFSTASTTAATTDDDDAPPDGTTRTKQLPLLYGTEESPPWPHCLVMAFQHYLVFIGGSIATPLLVISYMCMEASDPHRGDIVSSVIFVSGIITILQTTFGIRLPIIQGSNFAYVAPTIAILSTSFPPCDTLDLPSLTEEQRREQWQIRMREVQGAIAVSAVLQVFLGLSGAVGILLRFITPLTIVPSVTLLGLSLITVGAKQAASHWGISALTLVLLVILSQYLKTVLVPHPTYVKGKGVSLTRSPLFTYFPVSLGIRGGVNE
ncbi:Solute carrier family 23 member 2 [Chionoecetes opilio]|uniref:Solute carrier family 23 member 2 n=1 Tax=Chionoecetes opilio TaxID=41210 RepID=A0A8J4XXN7_CHIOP|nr:Solute carrier family 23 member 2 [Chionoecetes opilio]